MTAPNRNALWGEVIADELAAAGVSAVCVAPGSRSTPLTVAFAAHPEIAVYSHLDERSAAFFALGRGRRTGEPTALVCTSGTAAANFHPAVIEADEGTVPLVVLTADRPPELHDSGANQTVDQTDLYGDAPRLSRTLPEPEPTPRKLRSLRVAVCRAVDAATGVAPGPVHLNVPFRKPLEPVEVPGDVPDDLETTAPLAATGRDGPFVRTSPGRPALADSDVDSIASTIADADRGLLVCGPARPAGQVPVAEPAPDALAALVEATGFPVLADPLSGHRFGVHVPNLPVCGGYDSYLDAADDWPDPEVVVRFGASPTSKVLRHYLREAATTQFVVDPAGGWPEAEFMATDLVRADPSRFATNLAAALHGGSADDSTGGATDCAAGDTTDSPTGDPDWRERFTTAEDGYWTVVDDVVATDRFEGGTLSAVAELLPDPATLVVSNSMPVRDLDRFGRPRGASITALGNRGASGIDGVVSTALGAGSATEDPLVAVLGDLAYYHDMNGLLALARCDVDATIVLIDNDGGGIFHKLPVEDFDPPFTDLFRTPHGLDFEPTADLYDLDFLAVDGREAFRQAFEASIDSPGTQVLSLAFDAAASHRKREDLHDRVRDEVLAE